MPLPDIVPTASPLLTMILDKTPKGILVNLLEAKSNKSAAIELYEGYETTIMTPDKEPIIRILHNGDKVQLPMVANTPNWTLFTNIDNGDFVGMQWEFFYDEKKAHARYLYHTGYKNRCPTLRRFHENDRVHMGAVHR